MNSLISLHFGSSPRVRGTLRRFHGKRSDVRFIPAGAGNTTFSASSPLLMSVHPRGCGEHKTTKVLTSTVNGSSPRVRGTHDIIHLRPRNQRFIPAGAGNTCCSEGFSGSNSVHPRGCGEHELILQNVPALSGSSPRVRGTLLWGILRLRLSRFIPAGAGNTISGDYCSGSCSVHPRGCGEHKRVMKKYPRVIGSSPRVRGTRLTNTVKEAQRLLLSPKKTGQISRFSKINYQIRNSSF